MERTTREKGERLFDANRQVLYEQTCDDIDTWMADLEKQMITETPGEDLASVNILMQKQQMIETQMAIKAQQVPCSTRLQQWEMMMRCHRSNDSTMIDLLLSRFLSWVPKPNIWSE